MKLFLDSLHGPSIPIAQGCQAMNQPGYDSPGCPDLYALARLSDNGLPPCCRFDGTCGLDLSTIGAGCVQSFFGGKPIPCGFPDAGLVDGSTN
jgi:hypothetical protein